MYFLVQLSDGPDEGAPQSRDTQGWDGVSLHTMLRTGPYCRDSNTVLRIRSYPDLFITSK
jgi:hypothetical protein